MYKINFFENDTPENYYDGSNADNVITFVVKKNAVCMDIEADGESILPIMKKIHASLENNESVFASRVDGFISGWIDTLKDPKERKNMIWNYSGAEDIRNNCWTYSWGIEFHEGFGSCRGSWYIFVNVAI